MRGFVLRLMQHYIFSDISKASFHPTHKALRVEHISQFPWNNLFLKLQFFSRVKVLNHGTEDAIINIKEWHNSPFKGMSKLSLSTYVCICVRMLMACHRICHFLIWSISQTPGCQSQLKRFIPTWTPNKEFSLTLILNLRGEGSTVCWCSTN